MMWRSYQWLALLILFISFLAISATETWNYAVQSDIKVIHAHQNANTSDFWTVLTHIIHYSLNTYRKKVAVVQDIYFPINGR